MKVKMTLKMPERHQFILNCLKENPYVEVAYLTEVLKVSEMTIRRDLTKLEEARFLLRVHGGARRIPSHRYEASLDDRLLLNRKAKEMIAQYAARLVEDGDVIAMDASTTTSFMVEYLQNRPITVITNNISVALGFNKSENTEVILLGGSVKGSSLYTYGTDVLDTMRRYHTNKAFFSSTSLDSVHGLTNAGSDEGETKKLIISSAEHTFLLMDSSKFGTVSFYSVADLSEIDHMITEGERLTPDMQKIVKYCKDSNTQIHYSDSLKDLV
ncbi:MAG: DeoR/GlpR family DNA-binding transcription regulator [Tissierellia bacterium]|nr:DeoR/GlpR family DNA-binding transcription regulator [Tissierellia bacterium]